MLSVGLTASTFTPLSSVPTPAQPPVTLSSGRAAGVSHSTNTSTVVVAFRSAPSDPAAAAIAATRTPAWDIAQATATGARTLRSDAAAVTFDTSLTREQATKISKAAAKTAGIKYAEPSVTFYPTDAGGSGYYWNIDQINASAAWANVPSKGKGVVVAVIDTGIADNQMLKKALLVDTIGGVTSGTTISGTTWPGRAVTIAYTSKEEGATSAVTAPADAQGKWSIDLDPKPIDGTTLTASVPNGSAPATVTEPIKVDSTVTEFSVAPSNGSSFHGTVEPGSKVTLSLGGWQAPAGVTDGTWALDSPNHTFTNGQVVTVTAIDKRGNKEILTVVIDQISELSVVSPSRGTITGTAEVGSKISVTLDSDELCPDLVAGSDRTFSCTLNPVPAHDSEVTVTATDPATNVVSKTVKIDTKKPVVTPKPSNGTVLKGTVTDEGPDLPIVVTATFPDDTTAKTTVTSGSNWSITDLPTLKDGDTVTITAKDAAGNVGEASLTIDKVAPAAPAINATNGELVGGTSEPGATITVTYKVIVGGTTRRPITETHAASGVVDDDGTWSLTLAPTASDNTMLSAAATDPSGNTGPATTRQVHVAAPSAPTVAISNGTVVNIDGVEDGAAPSIVDSSDAVVPGTWADQGDGAWTFMPTTALTEADTVFVFVTDSDGTPSDKVAVTIDTTAPDAPVITDATPASVNGTGEVNATITISYHGADDADHTVTTLVDTNGSWATVLDPAAEDDATLSVTQTDLVGNVSPAATLTLVAPSPSPSPEAAPAGTGADGATADDVSDDDVVGTASSGTVLPGYDFMDGDTDATDPGAGEHRYHGTHVAGIVAASGWAKPTGVAPGVKILPIRALSDTGTLENVADAITWAVDSSRNPYPADVLNLSLGASDTACPGYLQSAIDTAVAKGTAVVVSAGNSSSSIERQAPANCRGVIVVTATNADGTRATYSSWGSPNTSGYQLIAAPGGSGNGADCTEPAGFACTGFVVSTFGSGVMGLTGTSMAAPHVAGTAALLKSLDKALTPAEIAYYIRGTATPLADNCPTGTCGSGIVNAYAATAAVKARVTPNTGSGPTVSVPAAVFPSSTAAVAWPRTARVGQVAGVTDASTHYGATYQWYRRWYTVKHGKKYWHEAAIVGATGSSYAATRSDYGKYLWVTVRNLDGTTQSSGRSGKITTGYLRVVNAPWISGNLVVGQRLTAHKPVWSDSVSSTKYQWYRNGKKISKATKSTYKLTKKDHGKRITVKVSVTAKYYKAASAKSAATTAVQ